MRIRTQLIVALVLLAVLPLAGIVLYSYLSSRQAIAVAAEAEAESRSREMVRRLDEMRAELEGAAERFGTWAFSDLDDGEALDEVRLARALEGLGEDAELVDSFVLRPAPLPPRPPDTPLPSTAPAAPADDDATSDDATTDDAADDEVRIDVGAILRLAREEALAEIEAAEDVPPIVEKGMRVGFEVVERILADRAAADAASAEESAGDDTDSAEESAGEDDADRTTPRRTTIVESTRRGMDHAEAVQRRLVELQRRLDRARRHEAARASRPPQPGSAPAPSTGDPETWARRMELFGIDPEVAIRDGERILGRVRPSFDAERMVERVLARSDDGDDDGAVPFAIDAEGGLYVAGETDRERVDRLGLADVIREPAADAPAAGAADPDDDAAEARVEAGARPARDPAASARPGAARRARLAGDASSATGDVTSRRIDDWLVVYSRDPKSDLVLGIASPLSDSLAELRATALRNLLIGLGLIATAMIGILPLSRRMTRGLDGLTAGVERLARGDLEARVPAASNDELGRLARAFNHMAGELETHQARLVDQKLIAAELERKSEELEDARRFQLSMLPRELPEHPDFELAVAMRTAAEVGGDYYDFLLEDDGSLVVAIGDATGHGAAAGRMVTVVKSLFCSWAGSEPPAVFLAAAQRTVRRLDLGRMAMALALARFAGRELTLANAGMPPVLIYRAGRGEVEEVATPGMPLGGLDERYDELRVALEPGDAVLLLSDGLPELPDASGEPLGYPAARELFAEAARGETSPREMVRKLLAALDARIAGQPPADDVTFLVVRVR